MRGNYQELKNIYDDLKSKVGTRSSSRLLLRTKNRSKFLVSEITQYCFLHDNSNIRVLTEEAQYIFKKIIELIDNKAENPLISLKATVTAIIFKNRLFKMALVVDVKLGTSLIPIYDGNTANLDGFIDAVTLFETTVNQAFEKGTADQKTAASNTVLQLVRTRLTGKARQALAANQSLKQLLDAIRVRCASKVSPDSVIAKLKTLKQGGDLNNFCDQVDKLCNELQAAYLRDAIPQDTASKMATKRGVESLINGTKNSETRMILKAGTYDSISDAIQKVLENDACENKPPSAQMFAARSMQQPNRRGNFSNNRGHGRGYFVPNRGSYNNFQRNGNFRGNFHGRGNFTNRGYHQGRGSYHQRGQFAQRGHSNPHYGMYVAQNIPQQFNQQQNPPPVQSNMQPTPLIHHSGQPQLNFLGLPQGQFMP